MNIGKLGSASENAALGASVAMSADIKVRRISGAPTGVMSAISAGAGLGLAASTGTIEYRPFGNWGRASSFLALAPPVLSSRPGAFGRGALASTGSASSRDVGHSAPPVNRPADW
jgi:hypothetical protein